MADLIEKLDELAAVIEDVRVDILMHLLIEKTNDADLKSFDEAILGAYRTRVSAYSEQHQQELGQVFDQLVDQIPREERLETG